MCYNTPMSQLDVICFGSVTVDLFIHPNEMDIAFCASEEVMQFPIGAKINIDQSFSFAGGGAANSAIGFAKMGLSVGIGAVIGDGEHADFIEHQLHRYDIDATSLVQIEGRSTSASTIFMTPDGRRTVFCQKLKSDRMDGKTLLSAPPSRAVYVSHLPDENEGLLHAVSNWKTADRIFAWNPGKTQFRKGLSHYAEALKSCDLLILNKEEAELFTGLKAPEVEAEALPHARVYAPLFDAGKLYDASPLADAFLGAGVGAVIITDGPRGAQFYSKGKTLWCPSQAGKPKNTLGAGDAFSVGAVSALLNGLPPHWMMRWGSLNAFATCQEFGAQKGQLTLGRIKRIAPLDGIMA